MHKLLVVGAGGYARAVAEAVEAAGEYALAGFVDDRWPELPAIWGIPIVGRLADLPSTRALADRAVVAIGDNLARGSAIERLLGAGYELVSVIHPHAKVSPRAVIGKGVTVMAGAIAGTEARLDDGVIVNAGAVVDHHCHIGRFAHVGIGACIGGGAILGPGAWLKEGCVLSPGQKVGAGEIVSRASQNTERI